MPFLIILFLPALILGAMMNGVNAGKFLTQLNVLLHYIELLIFFLLVKWVKEK